MAKLTGPSALRGARYLGGPLLTGYRGESFESKGGSYTGQNTLILG